MLSCLCSSRSPAQMLTALLARTGLPSSCSSRSTTAIESFDGPLPTKPPLFLSCGPDLGAYCVILGSMRPKSQLVLKDSAITKPSGLREFLGELKKSESVSGYYYIPAREPALVDFPAVLDGRLREVLEHRSITKLYSHQAEAFELVRNGKNIVIVTPTASGKTLCYNLPVLQRIVENPDARALYLYPTKA